jgi:hypothetical protein
LLLFGRMTVRYVVALLALSLPAVASAGEWVPVNAVYAQAAKSRGKMIAAKPNPVAASLGFGTHTHYEYKPNAVERLFGFHKALQGPR